MKAPGTAYDDPVLGKDPQPAHMKDYQNVPYDNGGVHINSGIPNHAFYLAAIEIGGFAWEKIGQIWYIALRDRLKFSSDFAEAAQVTYTVAGELYGSGSLEQQAVRNGWEGVGVSLDGGGWLPGRNFRVIQEVSMKVFFERTGGFAGMRMAATIDAESLPPEEKSRLEQNLASARFFDLPAKLASPQGGADRFQYRIEVETPGQKHSVEFGEAAAPEELKPLIQQLTILARSAK